MALSNEEVNRLINVLDSVSDITGQQKVSDVFGMFTKGLPIEAQRHVMDEVRTQIAEATQKSLEQVKKKLGEVASDEELISKLREMQAAKDTVA